MSLEMEKGRKVAEGKLVVETNEYDVFLGRGKNSFYRDGNVNFRKLSLEMAHHHEETRGRETKVQLARQVVAKVKSLGGRFLRPVTASNASGGRIRGAFEVVSEEVALTKTKQAIRDAGTGRRQSKAAAQKQAQASAGTPSEGASLGHLGVGAGRAQSVVGVSSLEASTQIPKYAIPQLYQPFATIPLPTPNLLPFNPNSTSASLGATQSSMLPTPQVPPLAIAADFSSRHQILAMLPMIAQSQREQQQSMQQHHSLNLAGSLLSSHLTPYGFLAQANQTQNSIAPPLNSHPLFESRPTPTNEPPAGGLPDALTFDELKPPAAAAALTMNAPKPCEVGFSPTPIPTVQRQRGGLLASAPEVPPTAPQDHTDPLIIATGESPTNLFGTTTSGRSGSSPISTAFENSARVDRESQPDSDNSSSCNHETSSTHTTLSEQGVLDR